MIVAVAGTHGKTTTTAMIALALTRAGLDPGFLVGGEAPDLGANARWGDPRAPLVIEADEYDRTFLALTPRMAVITNVEWDHVDIYRIAGGVRRGFSRRSPARFATRANLIICGDDPGALRVAEQPERHTVRHRRRGGARPGLVPARAAGLDGRERRGRRRRHALRGLALRPGAPSRPAAWAPCRSGCTARTMSATRSPRWRPPRRSASRPR